MTTETDGAAGEVLVLTDLDRAALAPYQAQRARAEEALGVALGLLLAGKGVDVGRCDACLSADGAAVLIQPRPSEVVS